MKKSIEALLVSQDTLNVTIDTLRDSLADAECDKKTLIDKCSRHEQCLMLHEVEIKSLKKAARERDRHVQSLEVIVEEQRKHMDSLEQALESTQKKCEASEEAIQEWTLRASSFTQEVAKLHMESKTLHSRAVKAEQELACSLKKLNDMQKMEEERVSRRIVLKMKASERAKERKKQMEMRKSESMPISFEDCVDMSSPTASGITRLPKLGDKGSLRLQRANSDKLAPGTSIGCDTLIISNDGSTVPPHMSVEGADGHTDGKRRVDYVADYY